MLRLCVSLSLLFLCFLLDAQPLDDIVQRKIVRERKVLDYAPLREADIFWEKRIWRVLDVREKMNQVFAYPENPFFNILADAAHHGDITLYSVEDDQFKFPLDTAALNSILYNIDTVLVINPITQEEEIQVVRDDIFFEDIKRFRIKEVWYFDSKIGQLKVRILGIAPLIEVHDDFGNFRYEKPLFWAYYPELRHVLANHEVFNPENDSSAMSWEDWMEMRFFSSYIYKGSNVHDRRLEEHLTGVDLLLESDKIKQEIFNFEHDLWSF